MQPFILSGASVAGHRWTEAYRKRNHRQPGRFHPRAVKVLAKLRNPPTDASGRLRHRDLWQIAAMKLLTEAPRPAKAFSPIVCRQWEAAAEPAVHAGIRVVHLRFGVVLGPGHGALKRCCRSSGQAWVANLETDSNG